jgi:hypothetical protein
VAARAVARIASNYVPIIEASDSTSDSTSEYGFSQQLVAEPGSYRRGLNSLVELTLSGALKLNVYGRHPLARAQQVLDDVRDRKTHGKVVLVP